MGCFQVNNFDANWKFNPPNLLGGKNSHSNRNQGAVRTSPDAGYGMDAAMSNCSRHSEDVETEGYDSPCFCGAGTMEAGEMPAPPGRLVRPEQPVRPGQTERLERLGQPEQPGRPEQTERPGRLEHTERPVRPEQPGRLEQPGQTERPGRPEQLEQPGQTEQPGQPALSGRPAWQAQEPSSPLRRGFRCL